MWARWRAGARQRRRGAPQRPAHSSPAHSQAAGTSAPSGAVPVIVVVPGGRAGGVPKRENDVVRLPVEGDTGHMVQGGERRRSPRWRACRRACRRAWAGRTMRRRARERRRARRRCRRRREGRGRSRYGRRRPPARRTPRRCRRAANTRPSSVPCSPPRSRFLPAPWPRVAPRRPSSSSQYRRRSRSRRPGGLSCAGDASLAVAGAHS